MIGIFESKKDLFSDEELNAIRLDFPILASTIHGKPLVYFDNGATSQKPISVIEAVTTYYSKQNANIHRGVHTLSREITIKYETVRQKVAQFINAHEQEIIFTKGTTDSINLVAFGLSKILLKEGDEIIVSEMEHHSNILPWQYLAKEKGLKLKVVPVTVKGEIDLEILGDLISEKTKLLAITHISNTLGTINPIKEMVKICRSKNVVVLVDGAQSIPHLAINVADLDCDFFCFSGHKMYAPTGVGVLYAKKKWIDIMPPYQQGGGIIKQVSFEETEYIDGPMKFEAGTPNISGTIGLGTAIDYLQGIGLDRISAHETNLLNYLTERMNDINGLRIFGSSQNKAAVVSFEIAGIHNFDLGTLLDQQGIAVRTGHHCTQPLWKKLGVEGAVRVSLSFYNNKNEIDNFMVALNKSIKMLQ